MRLPQLNSENVLLGASHHPKSPRSAQKRAQTEDLQPETMCRDIPRALKQGLDFRTASGGEQRNRDEILRTIRQNSFAEKASGTEQIKVLDHKASATGAQMPPTPTSQPQGQENSELGLPSPSACCLFKQHATRQLGNPIWSKFCYNPAGFYPCLPALILMAFPILTLS